MALIHRIIRPISRVLRRRRMRGFSTWAQLDESTRVLDVGGGALNWELVPVTPDLTVLNLEPSGTTFREVVGDAMRLPFPDQSFDIVFSNSVIEHVSDHEAFAAEVRRVGRRYFVQTPNRAFPLEPHMLMPLVNYLPKRWQRRVYRRFTPWGWITGASQEYVDWFVDSTTMLGASEMRRLFPGSALERGRSLIARTSAET